MGNQTINTQTLYRRLVAAARGAGGKKCPPSMIHSNASKDVSWDFDVKEFSLELPSGGCTLHLQIRLEIHETTRRKRVIIFGRRSSPPNSASYNTQRATFNSDNWNEANGYWIRPQILKKNPSQRHAFATLLPLGNPPDWNGHHFRLGHADPDELLQRFLLVLRVIEQVKSSTAGELSSRFPAPPNIAMNDLLDLRKFHEGAAQSLTVSRRKRCKELLDQTRIYFQQRSTDGKLRCTVCDWAPTLSVRSEIVQVHHIKPLSSYPKRGKDLTWAQAIANFCPLCPNCHRVLESHPNGGHYSVMELIQAVQPLANQSASVDRQPPISS